MCADEARDVVAVSVSGIDRNKVVTVAKFPVPIQDVLHILELKLDQVVPSDRQEGGRKR